MTTLAQMNVLPEQTFTLVEELVKTLPKKVRALLEMRGQMCSITYARECKMRKGEAMIYKYSDMIVRVGIEYDNIKAVKEKRESGELPALNQGLSWGSYVPGLYPFIITHKDNLYFRFFTVPNNPTVIRNVSYMRDGKEITKEEAQVACLASEFAERETTLETFCCKLEGILLINGKEVV